MLKRSQTQRPLHRQFVFIKTKEQFDQLITFAESRKQPSHTPKSRPLKREQIIVMPKWEKFESEIINKKVHGSLSYIRFRRKIHHLQSRSLELLQDDIHFLETYQTKFKILDFDILNQKMLTKCYEFLWKNNVKINLELRLKWFDIFVEDSDQPEKESKTLLQLLRQQKPELFHQLGCLIFDKWISKLSFHYYFSHESFRNETLFPFRCLPFKLRKNNLLLKQMQSSINVDEKNKNKYEELTCEYQSIKSKCSIIQTKFIQYQEEEKQFSRKMQKFSNKLMLGKKASLIVCKEHEPVDTSVLEFKSKMCLDSYGKYLKAMISLVESKQNELMNSTNNDFEMKLQESMTGMESLSHEQMALMLSQDYYKSKWQTKELKLEEHSN